MAARGARPRRAQPPDGAGQPVLRQAPRQPLTGSHTPSTAPARGGVSQGRQQWWWRLAPGRGGGGEEEKMRHRPAPPMPSGPGEGAAGTRHSLPGDAGGEGRGGEPAAAPWLGGALRCPRGGRANQATPPPSPGPHDSALGEGRRGDWDGLPSLYRPVPVFQALLLAFPHLPILCRPPLCVIHCQEKGTETRKEGSRGGRSYPNTAKTPRGMGVGQALVPSPPP